MHGRKVVRFRARSALLCLSILIFFAGCQRPSIIPSGRGTYRVPSDPPKSRYVIDARIDDVQRTIEGRENIVLKNSSTLPISVIAFDWQSSGSLSLDVIARGRKLSPSVGPADTSPSPHVIFNLPESVNPGSKLRLDVTFGRKFGASQEESHGTSNWYPRLWWDGLPLYDAFSVKLDVPAGYVLAASGRLDPQTGRYETVGARTFGIYFGKDMKAASREVEGVLILSLFTEKGAKAAVVCLETAVDAVKYYKHWLGFYPYPFLTIIPGGSGRWGGYPFATGIVAIHGLETYRDGESPLHWQKITSHEIGHEYWGEWVLDFDTPDWLWISLGIFADTEYMTARKFDPDRRTSWTGNYIRGISMHYDMTLDIPPALEKRMKYDRNNTVVHSKGPAVIFALDSVLGREMFDRIYKKTLRIFRGKRLGWRDLQKLCEAETGQNLKWFFDAWVRTNDYLCYAIDSQECRPEGDKYLTEIRVKRLGTMKMPVPVKAVFEDGTEQTLQTDRNRDVDGLLFRSKAKLRDVVLNPDKKLAMADKPVPGISNNLAALLAYGWDSADSLKVFEAISNEAMAVPELWCRLGTDLYEKDHLNEAVACFEKVAGLEADPVWKFAAQGWLGLLADLQGRRTEALEHYRQALKLYTGMPLNYGDWRMDGAWVEERLKTPFRKEPAPRKSLENQPLP
jgi:hypothetical protein